MPMRRGLQFLRQGPRRLDTGGRDLVGRLRRVRLRGQRRGVAGGG